MFGLKVSANSAVEVNPPAELKIICENRAYSPKQIYHASRLFFHCKKDVIPHMHLEGEEKHFLFQSC
jgi:hypothetical protein